MKKITAAFAACIMLLCAASCSSGREESGSQGTSSGTEETTAVTTEADTTTVTEQTTAAATTTEAEQETKTTSASAADPDSGEGEDKVSDIPAKAEETIKKYLSCASSVDAAGMLSCFYPQDITDLMKENGYFDDFSSILGNMENSDDLGLKECTVTGAAKMDGASLKGVEKYFRAVEKNLECKTVHDIKEGYFTEVDYKYNDGSGDTEKVSVAMTDSGEWVIIPLSESELASFAEKE